MKIERFLIHSIDRCLVWYQRFVSPLFPPSCRFEPTCSQYAREALQKHGLFRGGVMALWRIMRCHPYSRGGYDPVK
ncbi:MAG: membrane protein insertion efficiency factor YidD [Candidatus Atribacteria bacterium]|nr:membrane protein insertion efficiency factor YidD [Candidatus Atribacteria bacterium]